MADEHGAVIGTGGSRFFGVTMPRPERPDESVLTSTVRIEGHRNAELLKATQTFSGRPCPTSGIAHSPVKLRLADMTRHSCDALLAEIMQASNQRPAPGNERALGRGLSGS